MCVNNPAPTVARYGAAIAPRPTGSAELVSDDFPVFRWRKMPESANRVQQSITIIEIRPFRGGWQCFEARGVQPYWTGKNAKEDAIGYATARAKFGRGEIRVLNADGSIKDVIRLDGSARNYD